MKFYYKNYYIQYHFNEDKNEMEQEEVILRKELDKTDLKNHIVNTFIIPNLVLATIIATFIIGAIFTTSLNFRAGLSSITIFVIFGSLIYNYTMSDRDILPNSRQEIKYFAEEIEKISEQNRIEEERRDRYRETHILEEYCRLALTKNPVYIANLIRYVKEKFKE